MEDHMLTLDRVKIERY